MIPKVSVLPTDSQQLIRGDDLTFPFTIDRVNCDESVLFRLENLPPGVRMIEQCRIPRGESTAICRLRADPDAGIVPDQEVLVVASAPGIENARHSIRLEVIDRDLNPGKGVGPKGSVEPGRAKYWTEARGPSISGAAEQQAEERSGPATEPSYFREAMTGFGEFTIPLEPSGG